MICANCMVKWIHNADKSYPSIRYSIYWVMHYDKSLFYTISFECHEIHFSWIYSDLTPTRHGIVDSRFFSFVFTTNWTFKNFQTRPISKNLLIRFQLIQALFSFCILIIQRPHGIKLSIGRWCSELKSSIYE